MLACLKLLKKMPRQHKEVIRLRRAGCRFRDDWYTSTDGYLAPFVGIALGCGVDCGMVELEILKHCVSLSRGAVHKNFLLLFDLILDESGNLLLDFVDALRKLQVWSCGVQS